MDLEALERRIRVLEDVEAIKKLKARYCAYCDDDYDVEGLSSLFTEDAVWDGGEQLGTYEGLEAIRAFFSGSPLRVSFAIHHVTNPVIEVEGDRASGKWYLFQPCTRAEGHRAVWLAARYEEEYVRIGGGWRFRRIVVFPAFYTPFDRGWARQRFLAGPEGPEGWATRGS